MASRMVKLKKKRMRKNVLKFYNTKMLFEVFYIKLLKTFYASVRDYLTFAKSYANKKFLNTDIIENF